MSEQQDPRQSGQDETERDDLELPDRAAENVKGGAIDSFAVKPLWSGPGDDGPKKAPHTIHHKL
jgi:hypothetical protein